MEKEKYKKLKIALTLKDLSIIEFAKRLNVSDAAIIQTAKGKTTSKKITAAIDHLISDTLPKGLLK